MNRMNTDELEQRLRSEPVPPPEDLAARIRAEIPRRPQLVDRPRTVPEAAPRSARRWALAATIAVAVIGTAIVYQLQWRAPQLVEEPVERSTAERRGAVPGTVRTDELVTPAVPAEKDEPKGGGRAASSTAKLLTERRESPVEPGAETFFEIRPRGEPLAADEAVESARGVTAPSLERRLRAPIVPSPSTGGTSEPNDQPYGDMFFGSWGVNPFVDTEDDRFSTFGLDVDTGSYTLARGYIERGHLPPPLAVRVEEFLNYFDYGDTPPETGDFAVHAETAAAPFAAGPRYRLLRFNLHGREIEASERLPATLVFVVDVSGSMDRGNRLRLVKQSLGLLLDQLRPDDRVGLVVYGTRGRVLLEPIGDLEKIRSAIERLRAEGSTNAEEGLVLAYELMERYRRPGAIHRVVLCSDGVANVGRTGPGSILERIGRAADSGIELTTVGFGMGNYNDLLMEQLADRGDGAHAYVDTLDEARRIFVEELTGTLQTIASEVKVQVEFDPAVVSRYRLLGYENRDIADERFRDPTVDAGEVGAGHSVTALYEVKVEEGVDAEATLATLRLRYRSHSLGQVLEVSESVPAGDLSSPWEAASPSMQLSALVAEFAEILRQSYWARDGDLEDLFRRAQNLPAVFSDDVEVATLVSLIGRAARLAETAPAD